MDQDLEGRLWNAFQAAQIVEWIEERPLRTGDERPPNQWEWEDYAEMKDWLGV